MSESANDKSYGILIREIESNIKNMQQSEDIDDVLRMFELASENLRTCENKIESARGRFEKILNKE